MRSIRVLPVLAAATASLALAVAGASAAWHPSLHGPFSARHLSPNGRCSININLAPHRITAGDSALVWGSLRCRRGSPGSGVTVSLLQRPSGAPGFGVVQTTSTDASGFYEFTVSGLQSNSTFYVTANGAASGRRSVRVGALVTLIGPPEGSQLLTGRRNRVTFTGTVVPADVSARVILQRQNALTGNEWRRIDAGRVSASGTFSITHTFIVPGDANIRVLVRSQGRNVPSASNVLTYEISQAQNPRLTIAASADPISYGQPLTISGTVAGAGPGRPVTLLARTAEQRGFAPVVQGLTGAGGGYTFAGLLPVNSTFYEVRAGRTSAVLYVGVKDVLTAAVFPTTVQAGGRLMFFGTVAPDHARHVIYLERQDASGGGFHVVQVASVSPGSSYLIAHTVYDAGTKVFRVMIPGGPENEGAASPPFSIVVTPAPAAALTPEAPGNSTLPPDGQT
jgi:hypothetical protein